MAHQSKSGALPSPQDMWPHLYTPTRVPQPGAHGETAWSPPLVPAISSIANSVQDDSDDDLLAAGIAFDAAMGSAVAEAITTADVARVVHVTSSLNAGLAAEPTDWRVNEGPSTLEICKVKTSVRIFGVGFRIRASGGRSES